jgi:hypothetical protein
MKGKKRVVGGLTRLRRHFVSEKLKEVAQRGRAEKP